MGDCGGGRPRLTDVVSGRNVGRRSGPPVMISGSGAVADVDGRGGGSCGAPARVFGLEGGV